MPTELGFKIMQEQMEWQEFALRTFGEGVWLYYVSSLDSDRRVYRYGSKVAKVRRIRDNPEQSKRQFGQDLRREHAVLEHVDNSLGIRLEPVYTRSGEWEHLVMNYREGTPFTEAWSGKSLRGRLSLALRAARGIVDLNRSGVLHGDVVPNNLIVDSAGHVSLVDFGSATVASAAGAMLKEWSRIVFGRHGLLARSSKNLILRLAPATQGIYRKIRMGSVRPFKGSDSTNPDLKLLEEAWRESARWHTSLGAWLSYSSITVGGQYFPGQSPWLLRWNHISERVSFRSKRVLDLGCSIGLLSTFASLDGAASCRGFEADPSLVQAAKKIAQAFGAEATFETANLDELRPSDDRVQSPDLVAAMSIMEWVKDKENLLALIGLGREVLYEGHESLGIELNRLRKIGFHHVDLVSVSERGRPILHGIKRDRA